MAALVSVPAQVAFKLNHVIQWRMTLTLMSTRTQTIDTQWRSTVADGRLLMGRVSVHVPAAGSAGRCIATEDALPSTGASWSERSMDYSPFSIAICRTRGRCVSCMYFCQSIAATLN